MSLGCWRKPLPDDRFAMPALLDGKPIPSDLLGPLAETTMPLPDGGVLRAALERDGYLLLRGLIDPGDIKAAREGD